MRYKDLYDLSDLTKRCFRWKKRRNFLRYAYKAADVMGCPEIRQQVCRHVTWFNRAWEREADRVYGGLVTTL
ncbi:hypothetical protein CNY89_23810 [Amaricoccus sp. HAR-UPW-R2A-40]|nr:hypothetical protein CNY89_23810 [Amaricoccus sp. HAR-UPW-R2A-40]